MGIVCYDWLYSVSRVFRTVVMENKSSATRNVEMKFSASAFYYTGVTGEEIANGQFNTELTPGEGRTVYALSLLSV